MGVKPPIVKGEVPPDYRGPLYYRLMLGSVAGRKKPLYEMIRLEDREISRRLSAVNSLHAGVRKAAGLCGPDGELLPELRGPLKARFRANARKRWDEFSFGVVTLVSERIRDVIESHAPGVHYFVPVDIERDEGGSLRAYAFYCGLLRQYPALALEANGIEYSLAEDGTPVFSGPDWIIKNTDHFGYLDSKVVRGAPLLLDWKVWFLFSEPLVRDLGDVLPSGISFVPMGLV